MGTFGDWRARGNASAPNSPWFIMSFVCTRKYDMLHSDLYMR